MKPGELERNLSRLVELARSSRDRLAVIERELAELRREMETLAAQAADSAQAAAGGGRPPEPDAHGAGMRERGEDRSSEVGSE